MDERITGLMIGITTSLLSWEVWQNIFLSFLLAFIGAVAAWLARKLCDLLYRKYFLKP